MDRDKDIPMSESSTSRKRYNVSGSEVDITDYALRKLRQTKKLKNSPIVKQNDEKIHIRDENLDMDDNINHQSTASMEFDHVTDTDCHLDIEMNILDETSKSDTVASQMEDLFYKMNIHHAQFEELESVDGFFDQDNEIDFDSNKVKSLSDLLDWKGFFDRISIPTVISPAELLLMLLKFCNSNHMTNTGRANLFALINSIFAKQVLPQMRYKIDQIFNDQNSSTFHVICPTCSGYLGKSEELGNSIQCDICEKFVDNSKPSCKTIVYNSFVIIDPSTAIKEILENHAEYYDQVIKRSLPDENYINDIYDGEMYIDFVNKLPEEDRYSYVTTIFNTDGAAPFESSKSSVWPIYLMLNEIPPQDRFKNLIPCGLWFGENKPYMPVFLSPFVEVMNEKARIGIDCEILGEKRTIKPFTLVGCLDAVARAPVQGIKQFNGKFGCGWCLHEGKWIGTMKYVITKQKVEDRNHDKTVKIMEQFLANENFKPSHGIKYASPFLHLQYYNVIRGFIADYMHNMAEVGKQITNLLLDESDVKFFHEILLKIKSPQQVSRLTRSLIDSKYWNCREWESWILFYSIPLLSLRLDSKYVEYWTLFVESLYILLGSQISQQDLVNARTMLRKFVEKTQEYFGETAMTFNVHQLLHLADSVSDWGPLWAHSAFAFEAGNHQMLQAIKCARGAVSQILRNINVNRTVLNLEKMIYSSASEAVKTYLDYTLQSKTRKHVKVGNIYYFGVGTAIEKTFCRSNELSEQSKFYFRMVKNGCLYTSCLKQNERSDNSYAQMNDGRYIKISKFIVDLETKKELTLCHTISTQDHILSHNYKNLRIIELVDKDVTVIETSNIRTICMHMTVQKIDYVCSLPNLLFY